jgi:hypothetical protein
VSPFVHSLRIRLWKDFLGLKDEADIEDPVDIHVFRDIWKKTATKNTDIYKEVFGILPGT